MNLNSFNVYVGTEVGLLKGVNTETKNFMNLNTLERLVKEDEITAMSWENGEEKKVYTGHKNQVVKVFDCNTQVYSVKQTCNSGEGPIKGVYEYNSHIVTAVESGIVSTWKEDGEKDIEINTGGNLCKMTQNPFTSSQMATGGEENDLKLWDLQNSSSPLFTAKNVRNDFLDLRVPVWITDLKFKTNENIITCTRHHQIRLYDTKAQRRPVIDMEFERFPLMCLSLAHNEHQVVVGSSRGRLALIDLRKKLLIHVFKGFAGSIRSVVCHTSLPIVASCGLDRFLRIHDLNEHKLLKKIYLKTRMNCLLLKTEQPNKDVNTKQPALKKDSLMDVNDESIWDSMPVVKDSKQTKRGAKDAGKVTKKVKRKISQ